MQVSALHPSGVLDSRSSSESKRSLRISCGHRVDLFRHARAALLALCILPIIHGQAAADETVITLRFIDARNGKAFSRISVHLFAWNEDAPRGTPLKVTWSENLTADKEGKIVVRFSDEPPRHLAFVFPPEEFHECSDWAFLVEEVMRSGVVANYKSKCGKLKWKATAKPGEVVIFDKKLTVWERMRREIP